MNHRQMGISERKTREEQNLAKLPELAYVAVETEDVLCLVKRGEKGYHRTDYKVGKRPADEFAAEMNARLKVTPAQAEAMVNGSMFGWHTPAADVDRVTQMGGHRHG